jgi:iron complex outermembrane receptor protein
MTVDQNGTGVATADVARRFGEQQQVGVRINAAGGTLGSYLDDVGNGNRRFISAALDWRVNARLRLAADLEYDKRRVTEQVGITLPTAVNGVITLPATVDPKRLVGPDWAKFETETKNALLRADYALSDNWALTVEGGHSETARDRALPIFRFTNNAAIATGAGRITGNLQHSVLDSTMLRAELAGTVSTGPVKHDLTFGVNRTDKGQDPIYQATFTIPSQNLYNPTPITNYTVSAYSTTPTTAGLETRDSGAYAIDRMTFSPNWQAVAGVRSVKYKSDQGTNHYDVSKTTPMAALIYKYTDDLSFYVSGSQGLEEGETAPTGTANANQRLAPGVSRQKELGARWRMPGAGGTLVQASLFEINRPGYYTNTANIYSADGEQHFRGLELSTQGKLTPQLSWQTSAQFIDPEFRDIGAAYNGKLPENAAKRTASAFLSYELDAVPGLSFNGGAYYTGSRPVNDLNQAFLGGATLFSVGGRYVTTVMGKRTSVQLNVENAGGKEYWAGAGTRLSSGAPRLIKLGVKVDL